MKFLFRKYLSTDDLKQVSEKIAEVENSTSGEIRVSIRHHRRWGEGKLPLRDVAVREFHRLGMNTTKERTGVLIYLLISERKFEIIGDEGIHARIADGTWDRIAGGMTSHFKDGNFARGIVHAVENVGAELHKHFPRGAGGHNELPNDVIER